MRSTDRWWWRHDLAARCSETCRASRPCPSRTPRSCALHRRRRRYDRFPLATEARQRSLRCHGQLRSRHNHIRPPDVQIVSRWMEAASVAGGGATTRRFRSRSATRPAAPASARERPRQSTTMRLRERRSPALGGGAQSLAPGPANSGEKSGRPQAQELRFARQHRRGQTLPFHRSSGHRHEWFPTPRC
jgi:hypothetical protein